MNTDNDKDPDDNIADNEFNFNEQIKKSTKKYLILSLTD